MTKEVDSLKELLLNKICALEKQTQERFEATSQALRIQAAEYERRLEFLNGEAARLRTMQATYVPREVYDINQRELNEKVDSNTNDRLRGSGKSLGISTAWAILAGAAVTLTAVASLLFSISK